MEYLNPALTIAGTAQTLVLGKMPGDGEGTDPCPEDSYPSLLCLGLDD